MANLLNEVLFTKAIIKFSLTREARDIIDSYAKYDKFEDRRAAIGFARTLLKLNSLSAKHGFSRFISKAIESDEELVDLAVEGYDVLNMLVADECYDSYTQAEVK